MTIQQTLVKAMTALRMSGATSVALDAEVLLSHVLRCTKAQLLAAPERRLTLSQSQRFGRLVRERKKGWPVAYLIGHKEFYGLDFIVSPRVLIPRPDTEVLVDTVLQTMPKDARLSIADVGTGSGCIAVTLAKYLPRASITAFDISAPALGVAKKNALRHKMGKRIRFFRGDLLWQAHKKRFDCIVANLPYLTPDQLTLVPFEPVVALLGGKLGVEHIDRLLQSAPAHLTRFGQMFLEIDPRQSDIIAYIVQQLMPGKTVKFVKDLGARVRVARIG